MSSEEISSKKPKTKEMSFLDHLEELRWRIIKSFAAILIGTFACFAFSRYIVDFLTLPIHTYDPELKLIFLSPTGMFMVRILVSLVCGFIVALPVVVYHIYAFIVPGLYPRERKHVLPLIFMTVFCFLVGAAFAYLLIIPFGLRFLLGLATSDIEPKLDIGRYINFVTMIMLAFGLVFELPVMSLFLTKIGLLTPRFLRRSRRYAIVIIAILAALLTPPDIITQIMMILPVIILYEVSILISVLVSKKKQKAEEEEEKEEKE